MYLCVFIGMFVFQRKLVGNTIFRRYLRNHTRLSRKVLYLGKVMALRGSDGGGHYIGPSPKHLQKHLNRCRHDDQGALDRTFISGCKVFPRVARYSESATSGQGVIRDSEWLKNR